MKKYEYTRSIGFCLEGNDFSQFKPQIPNEDIDQSLRDFISKYKSLISLVENTVFFEDKDGKKQFSKFIKIKYQFLKQHAREDYYSQSSSRKHKIVTIKEAAYLHSVFDNWLSKNKEVYEVLSELVNRPEHNQASYADIVQQLKTFLSADYAFLIRDFADNAIHKHNQFNIDDIKKLTEGLIEKAQALLLMMAPNQSRGVEVARASFNYYTINKTSKDFGEITAGLKRKIKRPYQLKVGDLNTLKQVGFIDYLENQGLDINTIGVQDLDNHLKQFQSEQKKEFYEQVTKGELNEHNFYKKFPLFATNKQDVFLKFKEYTNLLNGADKARAREIRKKRGEFLQNHWGFDRYKKLSGIRKRIATTYGNIKAQIKAIEKEQVEARLLRFWAFIFIDSEGSQHLVLVPKEKRGTAKRDIEDGLHGKDGTLIVFHSLSFRALDKLLRKEHPKKIQKLNENEKYYVKFAQKALVGELEKIDLSATLDRFKNKVSFIANKQYADKNEFIQDVNKIFYKLETHSVDASYFKKWGAYVFKISSYDLEVHPPKLKEHTKIWNKFWENYFANQGADHYKIRINPELKLFYRNKFDDAPHSQSRFAQEQLRVQFTITENAGERVMDLSFKDNEDLGNEIEEFNKNVAGPYINKLAQDNNLWYYGIDRGNQELATLGIVRWTSEMYEVMLSDGKVAHHKKPEFAEIIAYRIKDYSATKILEGKTVHIFKNPSYFMGSEEEFKKYFVEEKTSFIDLTTAKLIKGKIILDGDILTYLALKRANAKRKLFNEFHNFDQGAMIEYCASAKCAEWNYKTSKGYVARNAFIVRNHSRSRTPCTILTYLTKQQYKLFGDSVNKLVNAMQEHLNNLRANQTLEHTSITQINNLRDAITANMVGLISHLFNNYPGFINLENLTGPHHFYKNNENIERRLEWALYRKFQKTGLVPPRLRNTIFLRENMQEKRIGIMHFIKTKDTSAKCPRCFEKAEEEGRKSEKWRQHSFTCTNEKCQFSTTSEEQRFEFHAVTNSDDVAACNIANPEFAKRNL